MPFKRKENENQKKTKIMIEITFMEIIIEKLKRTMSIEDIEAEMISIEVTTMTEGM